MAYVHDLDTPTETAVGALTALAQSLEKLGLQSGDTQVDMLMRQVAKAAREAANAI